MKVIPVIDVLNGVAVHGIRGERERYQPLKSVLCRSADPLDIALDFESLGFNGLYLADLDAILGKSANFNVYRQIMTETGLGLMVDAGIADLGRAEEVLATGVSKIVVGSETLESLDFLGQAVKAFGEDRVVVSVDLKEGKVLSASEAVASMDAISFAQELRKIGVNQIILLDLTRVGTEQGINRALLRSVLEKTGVEVLVGGGIMSLQELEELRNLGVYGALVATILHNGKLKIDELKAANLL
ncbi:MAG: HisA/HisF-related TIM barrel protein [Candidatus Bathyarchaeota archaeon]|jgi:phosphoribosylformimino-5-aminoimidazole carboxamide ribotide isomerase